MLKSENPDLHGIVLWSTNNMMMKHLLKEPKREPEAIAGSLPPLHPSVEHTSINQISLAFYL